MSTTITLEPVVVPKGAAGAELAMYIFHVAPTKNSDGEDVKCDMYSLGKLCDVTLVAKDGRKTYFVKWILYHAGGKMLKTTLDAEPTLQELDVLDFEIEAVEIVLRGLRYQIHAKDPCETLNPISDPDVIRWLLQAYELSHRWELTLIEKALAETLTDSTVQISYAMLTKFRSLHDPAIYQRALTRFVNQGYKLDEEAKSWEVQEVMRDLMKKINSTNIIVENIRDIIKAVISDKIVLTQNGFAADRFAEIRNVVLCALSDQGLAGIDLTKSK
jgi:hypothetical protein